MRLLRKCPCAVWLVWSDSPPRSARVLAAVDPAPHDIAQEVMNKTTMDLGQPIAAYAAGQLHVIHVWGLAGAGADESWSISGKLAEAVQNERVKVAAALDDFLSPYKLSHRIDSVHLRHDESRPGPAISELAKKEQIDLVVMGTIARTGFKSALLGNTAEKVLDRIDCSVLAVKPEGFVSPVSLPDT